MASEDVIELGSSDEESQPAPKKVIRKPKPNAMVHIPQGVTIKSAPKSHTNVNPLKQLLGKGVTVTKVNKSSGNSKQRAVHQISQPFPVRNGKTVSVPSGQSFTKGVRIPVTGLPPIIQNVKSLSPNVKVSPAFINPISVNRAHGGRRPVIHPIPVNNLRPKLPPSISLKKTSSDKILTQSKSTTKRSAPTTKGNINKKQKKGHVQNTEVMTVDLEDDEAPAPPTANPQWYLRPEEADCNNTSKKDINKSMDGTEVPNSKTEKTMEEINNSEPSKFIEITIEDSPLKSVPNKRTHEIGAELAITIDDSPVKPPSVKPTTSNSSDNENQETERPPKQSKKKLNYPKETIEIELEPINPEELEDHQEETQVNEDNSHKTNEIEVIIPDNVIEVFESPAKAAATPPSTPKKDKSLPQPRIKPMQISENVEPKEFHPVYQEFIDLCLQLENSNDMHTIVEKKIKNYYRQVPKEYTESEEFLELVQSKLMAMKAGPEKLYLYIKDVVDELNMQRKMAKSKPTVKETRSIEAENFQYGAESDFDLKRQRQIRKLEKTLKKLHRAIQKLEEQEVDFDDDEDSVYLLTERYKERMVRVHAKFCQLTNTKMPSEPRIQIDPRPGQPAGPAKRLEKWVNKKVPIGTPLPFPDFHDVLRCVRDANEEDRLGWNEADIMEEARDLFTRCGRKLQRRRQENEWRLAASRIAMDVDPAENSAELKKKLENNKQLAAKKETDVFNKYADKQSQLKLEAVEIGDKEAEESPAEEEDDDEVEEIQEVTDNLDDKERRKERIRRLLKEKSKKADSNDTASIALDHETDTKMESREGADNEVSQPSEKDSGINVMEVDKRNQDKSQSSDENRVNSDVDELHLLQKLHSDGINTSNAETTDSESAIDISDTLSSSDNKKPSSDVISIENSSYSESEQKNEDTEKDTQIDVVAEVNTDSQDQKVSKTIKFDNADRLSGEIECASSGIQLNKTNNDEYNESVESILLGTSDDDDGEEVTKVESPKNNDEFVNLKDDAISIGETAIQEDNKTAAGDKAESPPSDAKTIEDSPENVAESNSVDGDIIFPSVDPKEIITTIDRKDNCQDTSTDEKRESEMKTDKSENNDTNIVIGTEIAENAKSPAQINKSSHVTLDTDSNRNSKQKEKSNDTIETQETHGLIAPETGGHGTLETVELETSVTQKEETEKKSDNHISSSLDSEEKKFTDLPECNDNETVKETCNTSETGKTSLLSNSDALGVIDKINNQSSTTDSKNTESLESMILDLQSDLGMDEN